MSKTSTFRSLSSFVTALLSLLALPSCLTNHVWRLGDDGPKFVDHAVPCEIRADQLRAGEDPHRLELVESADGAAKAHVLYVGSGEEHALLMRPELFEVHAAAIAGRLHSREGELAVGEVELILRGRVHDSVWWQPAELEDLSPAAQRELQVGASSPLSELPPVMRDCWHRMGYVGGERMGGGKHDMRPGAFVFVRPNGEPVRRLGGGASSGNLTFADRGRVLGKFELYARIWMPNGTRVIKIDPAAFWLASKLDVQDGVGEYRCRAQVMRSNCDIGERRVAVPLRNELSQLDRRPREVSLWLRAGQVVLTPPAALIDAVITPPLWCGYVAWTMWFGSGC